MAGRDPWPGSNGNCSVPSSAFDFQVTVPSTEIGRAQIDRCYMCEIAFRKLFLLLPPVPMHILTSKENVRGWVVGYNDPR